MTDSNHELDALADALEQLSSGEALKHRNDELKPPGQRSCPICGQTMQTFESEGIMLDGCPGHGVWLDTGELKLLFERIEMQGGSQRKLARRADRRQVAAETRVKMANAMTRAAFGIKA